MARWRTWDAECHDNTLFSHLNDDDEEPITRCGNYRVNTELSFSSLVLPKEVFALQNDQLGAGGKRTGGRGRALEKRVLGVDKRARRPGESEKDSQKPTQASQFLGSEYLYSELFPELNQSASKITESSNKKYISKGSSQHDPKSHKRLNSSSLEFSDKESAPVNRTSTKDQVAFLSSIFNNCINDTDICYHGDTADHQENLLKAESKNDTDGSQGRQFPCSPSGNKLDFFGKKSSSESGDELASLDSTSEAYLSQDLICTDDRNKKLKCNKENCTGQNIVLNCDDTVSETSDVPKTERANEVTQHNEDLEEKSSDQDIGSTVLMLPEGMVCSDKNNILEKPSCTNLSSQQLKQEQTVSEPERKSQDALNISDCVIESDSTMTESPCDILMTNLPLSLTEEELWEIVEPYGEILSCTFREDCTSKSCHLRMHDELTGELLVVSVDGLEVKGHRIGASRSTTTE